LAQAFAKHIKPGDEIVVTNQEHKANVGVWRRLASEGIVVKEWRIDRESGALNPDDLDDLLSEKTKLVAMTHASNIVAHINPVAEVAKKTRAAGALTVIDGTAWAPHGFPDVRALGADIYF